MLLINQALPQSARGRGEKILNDRNNEMSERSFDSNNEVRWLKMA